MKEYDKRVILSAEKSNLTPEENLKRTNTLRRILKDLNIEFVECEGMYKGTAETSFSCKIDNDIYITILKNFAFDNFQQESILYQNEKGIAMLIYSNFTIELLGKYREITMREAAYLPAYTRQGLKYFMYS